MVTWDSSDPNPKSSDQALYASISLSRFVKIPIISHVLPGQFL